MRVERKCILLTHELVPAPVEVVGVEIPLYGLSRVPEVPLDLPEGVGHALLLFLPRGNLLSAEAGGRLGQAFHLDQSVGEIAVLR